MDAEDAARRHEAFNVLRRFARRTPAAEHCELCSQAVEADHEHLVEPADRRLLCVCGACAVLFSGDHQQYRRVPRRIRYLSDFHLSDAQWESLLIPIEMAFFYESSQAGRTVAVYPSPAGPVESLLPLETWQDIVRVNPPLAKLVPDVEALVANRLGPRGRDAALDGREPEYYILPIDQCYRLVGLIRLHWKGLSGGADVWKEMAGFFAEIRGRAAQPDEVVRA